jgi:hypothetical protein
MRQVLKVLATVSWNHRPGINHMRRDRRRFQTLLTSACSIRVNFLSVIGKMNKEKPEQGSQAHRAKLSLNSRCLYVSHAARLTCHGFNSMCFEKDGGSRKTPSGMRSSLKKASHQFELISSGARHSWYAFFSQILSSSQLRGEALSSAFARVSDFEGTTRVPDRLTIQTLLTFRAKISLKLVGPSLSLLQRRLPRRTSSRLVFLEQGNQRLQVLGQGLVKFGHREAW